MSSNSSAKTLTKKKSAKTWLTFKNWGWNRISAHNKIRWHLNGKPPGVRKMSCQLFYAVNYH